MLNPDLEFCSAPSAYALLVSSNSLSTEAGKGVLSKLQTQSIRHANSWWILESTASMVPRSVRTVFHLGQFGNSFGRSAPLFK